PYIYNILFAARGSCVTPHTPPSNKNGRPDHSGPPFFSLCRLCFKRQPMEWGGYIEKFPGVLFFKKMTFLEAF
ncbi:MAG: hypothetical protein ABF535_09730, partial [Acetobacter sp.]